MARICRNFAKYSSIFIAIFILLGVVESQGKSLNPFNPNHNPKEKDKEPHIPQPGLLFGGEDELLTSGSSGLGPRTLIDPAIGGTFEEDEKYVTDLVMKSLRRLVRSPQPQKDEDDDEDDDEDNEDNDNVTKEDDEQGDKSSTTTSTSKPSSNSTSSPKNSSNSTSSSKNSTNSTNSPTNSTSSATNSSTNSTNSPTNSSNSTSPVQALTPQRPINGSQGPPPPPGSQGPPRSQNGSQTGPPRPGGPPPRPQNGTQGRPPGFQIPPRPPGSQGPPLRRPPGPGGIPGRPQFQIPPHLLLPKGPPKTPAKKGQVYLPEDYNKLEIPKLDAGKFLGIKVDKLSPVPVLVFLNLRSVRDIDETDNELVLDMDMKVEWVDGVLFDPLNALTGKPTKTLTLDPIFLNQIWKPDIYIDELVRVYRAKLISKPHTLLFSPSSGLVSYTFRIATRVSCEMDFFYYPSDTHRCRFHLRSYSYFDDDLNLSWLRNGVYLQDPGDPNFDLQVESIETIKIDQTFKEKKNHTHDGLRFTILCRRKLSYHMVQTYLPSIFFIVITWLCFLVPARMVEARIGISMTTLLTLTAMFSSVRESTPIVSYVKAIDLWMVFCIFFVFLTLLEFSLLVWIRSTREDAMEKKLENERAAQEKRRNSGKGKNGRGRSPSASVSIGSVELQRYEKMAEFTEKWAFLIFSVVFMVFLVVYWSWLLVSSDYYDWAVNATHNAMIDDEDD